MGGPRNGADPIRVLHVDDDGDFRALAMQYLEQAEERLVVETAPDAEAALDRLGPEIDCVVSDYDMPGRDGIALLEAVREEYPDLPFILFTGKGSEEIASDAVTAGATDYLQKKPGADQFTLLANRVANAAETYQAREQARETRERFQKLLEGSADYIHVTDTDGTIEYITPSVERVLGYQPAKVTGENIFDFLHPDDHEHVQSRLAEALDSPGAEETIEARVRTRDGSWRWIEAKSRNLLEDPAVEGIVTNARDVTDRKKTQAAVDWHRAVIENLGEGVYIVDDAYDIQFASFREEVTELDRDEWIGADVATLAEAGAIRESDVEPIRTAVDAVLDSEREMVRLDIEPPILEDTRAIELTLRPFRSPTGEEVVLATTTDISDRRERAEQLRQLNTAARDLMGVRSKERVARLGMDAAREILSVPEAVIYLFDTDREALVPVANTPEREELGKEPALQRDDGPVWRAFRHESVKRLNTGTTDSPLTDGLALPLGGHGVLTVGSAGDDSFAEPAVRVAESLAASLESALDGAALIQDLERYETIVRAFPDEVYTLNSDGHFVSVIPRKGADRTTGGYDPQEVVGEHASAFVAEDDLERAEQLAAELLEDERDTASFEMDILTADGDRVPHETHLALLTGEDGSVRGTVWVLRDIAERKTRERRLRRQNDRLERFASLVSHDLRNPLNVASARLELAAEECDSAHLDSIDRAHGRMERLIDALLAIAREGEPPDDPKPIALGQVVEQCWGAAGADDATMRVRDSITVVAGRSRLERLLENLLRNAIEHGGEDVTVTVGATEDGFYVADDGPGIPEAERDRVFDLGYSTSDEGTGLGLHIVREMAEAHGWEITVRESAASGACFEFTGVETADG